MDEHEDAGVDGDTDEDEDDNKDVDGSDAK